MLTCCCSTLSFKECRCALAARFSWRACAMVALASERAWQSWVAAPSSCLLLGAPSQVAENWDASSCKSSPPPDVEELLAPQDILSVSSVTALCGIFKAS